MFKSIIQSTDFLLTIASYSTIAWITAAEQGKQANVDYGFRSSSIAGIVLNFFNGLGDIAFAYAGHNVVLEIQATIPSTADKPSKGPMWKGVIIAYIIVALCYFPVALVGYWIFGNEIDDNILITLGKPRWLIAAANLMVVIHVIGSYQVISLMDGDEILVNFINQNKFH
ncbi:hypothetical protein Cni_G16680 [Canna indica]|uniref:Amino acid transporter transmembrane domain-containing protein n=1 Tax=Canna indica TaxID=4628 RepID=A0AAQ3KFN9_9LILI|nr:hypothetical protein Cni_G16680 [Canna indica]